MREGIFCIIETINYKICDA